MQIGFWDENARLEKLSRLGDALEQLNQTIDWDVFRPTLTKVFRKEPKGAGGRPPYDYLLLFKILVLQKMRPSRKNRHKKASKNGMNRRISFIIECYRKRPHLFHGLLDNEPLPM